MIDTPDDLKNFLEKKEKIKENVVASIFSNIKNQKNEQGQRVYKTPFLRFTKAEDMQRAYNASNGNSFEGLNSLLLDLKKAERGYETNQWLTITGAKALGASQEDINALIKTDSWKSRAVKVHFLQTKERVPVFKKDANGEMIPLRDKNGLQKVGKYGNALFEIEKDHNNRWIYETKNLPHPVLITENYFNVAEFPSIKREKFKEILL